MAKTKVKKEISVKKKVSRIIIFVMIGFLAVSYIAYHYYRSQLDKVETQVALYTTAANTIPAHGIVVRNEQIISSIVSGSVLFRAGNGTRVSKGGVIAEVYASAGEVEQVLEAESLNTKYTLLAKLNQLSKSKDTTLNLETIERKMNSDLADLIEGTSTQDSEKIAQAKTAYTVSSSSRLIGIGKTQGFDTNLANSYVLLNSATSLCKKPQRSITSPYAGYFISGLDGYEGIFDYENATKITFDQLLQAEQRSPSDANANYIGKIVVDCDWYCIVIADQPAKNRYQQLTVGKTLTVRIADNHGLYFPATIIKVEENTETRQTLIVLQCDYMSSGLSSIRKESFELETSQFSGLKISKAAVRKEKRTKTIVNEDGSETVQEKEVEGVYVVYGNELRFKEIKQLYAESDYIICEMKPDENELFEKNTALKIYDEVVVWGNNLYDGKIIH